MNSDVRELMLKRDVVVRNPSSVDFRDLADFSKSNVVRVSCCVLVRRKVMCLVPEYRCEPKCMCSSCGCVEGVKMFSQAV